MKLLYLLGLLIIYFAYLIGKADLGNDKILHMVKMIVVVLLIAVVLVFMILEYLQLNYLNEMQNGIKQAKITDYYKKP